MKIPFLLPVFLVMLLGVSCVAQDTSYFYGKFTTSTQTHNGHKYTLYDFSREENTIKTIYFAYNSYNQYNTWKTGKKIILITSGVFEYYNGIPVGLSVDNGRIINRSPDPVMDGLVVVYNGGAKQGGIGVVDLRYRSINVDDAGTQRTFSPRDWKDTNNFLEWGKQSGVTLFQSQLVYSSVRSSNFGNLKYGIERERRFLAICTKNGVIHHIVVDAPDQVYLNLSASYAKGVLEYDGFEVLYIINLDTGTNNLLKYWNGSYLQDISANPDAHIDNVPNLLIYYTD